MDTVIHFLHSEFKKTVPLYLALANVDRLSKFHHCHILREICDKTRLRCMAALPWK